MRRKPTPDFIYTPKFIRIISHYWYRFKTRSPCCFNLHIWFHDTRTSNSVEGYYCFYCGKKYESKPEEMKHKELIR